MAQLVPEAYESEVVRWRLDGPVSAFRDCIERRRQGAMETLALAREYRDWREERGLSPSLETCERFVRWQKLLEKSCPWGIVDAPDKG